MRTTILALVWLWLAPIAAAQDTVPVKSDNLPGYEEAEWSEHGDLYDFTEFQRAFAKKRVTPRRLEELEELWRKEQARVKAFADALAKKDPKALFLRRQMRLLRNSFREVSKAWITEHDPLFLAVQKPDGADADYSEKIAAQYGPPAKRLLEIFRKEYVEPLKLELQHDHGAISLIVLVGRAGYMKYADKVDISELRWARAHYNPKDVVAVTYEPTADEPSSARERIHPVLHELVHALVDAHCVGRPVRLPVWFNEGLAEYLAYYDSDPSTLGKHAIDKEAVVNLAEIYLSDKKRKGYLLPLEAVATVSSYSQIQEDVRATLAMAGMDPEKSTPAIGIFYAQANLLMHYLHTERRDDVLEYTRLFLFGKGHGGTFASVFGIAGNRGFARLEEAFCRYVLGEYRKLVKRELSDERIEEVIAARQEECLNR
ncbi:MAG: hypothetical protein GY711_15770 [bacterium]|nr:hypothetical protein [bacterium]